MICKLEVDFFCIFPWLLFLVFYRFTTASAKDHRQDHHPPGEHREGAIWRGVEGPLAWRRGGSEDLLLQRGALLVPWGGDLPDCHASSWEHPGIYCCRQQRSDNNESASLPLSLIEPYLLSSINMFRKVVHYISVCGVISQFYHTYSVLQSAISQDNREF